MCFRFSWGPGSGLSGSYGNFSILRNCRTVFQNGCTNTTNNVKRFQFLHILANTCHCLFFFAFQGFILNLKLYFRKQVGRKEEYLENLSQETFSLKLSLNLEVLNKHSILEGRRCRAWEWWSPCGFLFSSLLYRWCTFGRLLSDPSLPHR